MDNQVPLPTPIGSPQPGLSQPVSVNSSVPGAQNISTPQASSDALARATAAIQAVIAQTPQNPAARMQAIIDIKATYIRDQFGVDVTQ